jgi:hypothetical protein
MSEFDWRAYGRSPYAPDYIGPPRLFRTEKQVFEAYKLNRDRIVAGDELYDAFTKAIESLGIKVIG